MHINQRQLNIAMLGHKHVMSREGGIEIVVKELSTRMAAKGHNVICYDRTASHVSGTASLDTRKEIDGVKIIPVWTVEKKGLAAMTSSFSACVRAAMSKADVVHIHAEGPAAMSFIPKLFGKRVIVTVHGLDWNRAKWSGFAKKYIKFGEKQAVKWADEIVVLSRGVQKYFNKSYGRKTVFIPNGVMAAEIVDVNEINRLWGLEKNSYVLFLGRIVPEKGIRYLIEAWKKINTDKKLVIAGGASDTDKFVNELKNMSSSDKRIVFTGFQQGRILEELYSNAYIYCLPSDIEGMPLSLLEAMSYGNCCVVSDIDECKDVVENSGITFRQGDVGDLRNVLQSLLDKPELVDEYAKQSKEFILNKYDWNEVVDKTLKLYGL